MGRTLPDDVPIESKTVAKAIERAQNTVEARNAEMRKDALKYDEVMDQQRKVIYERRLQIIDGDDLEERTEDLLAGVAEKLVAEHCPSEFEEDWDLKALIDGADAVLPDQVRRGRPGAGRHDRGPGRVASSRRRSSTTSSTPSPCPVGPRPCARSSATSTCRSWTPGGATTWPRWTTSRTASTCAGRSRPIPSTPGSRRATPCSASSWRSSTTTTCATSSTSRPCRRPRPSPISTGPSTPRPRTRWPRPGPWPRCSLAEQGRQVRAAVVDARPLPPRPTRSERPGRAVRHRAQVKRPNAPDPDALVPIVKAAAREGRAQRAVLVRERQEVQVLPWRRLTAPAAERTPGLRPELEALTGAAGRGRALPRAGQARGRGGPNWRPRPASPDLWDDADQARAVTKELGQVSADLDQLDGLRAALDDARGAAAS